MKKFFAFFAAALLSVSMFASKEVVPSDAVLATYYETGEVCVCIYVPANMACYDIIFAGTYNNWGKGAGSVEDVKNCVKFEAVDGYDGWYVAHFTDESEDIQGKPIMLDVDGKFNWAYQIGAANKIRGGVTVVAGQYEGEIDLKTYSKNAPNVFEVEAWKSNPCTAVYHNYTVAVINSSCDPFAVPYIVGNLPGNAWAFTMMTVNIDSTMKYAPNAYYEYKFKAAEGTEYQIVSGVINEQGAVVTAPGWNDASYLQVFEDGVWKRLPGEKGDNRLTAADANIVWDLRDATKYRWGRCVSHESYDYTVTVTIPECENLVPAISGAYNEWGRDTMTLVSGNTYTITFNAEEGSEFGITSVGYNATGDGWETWIEKYDEGTSAWTGYGNIKLTDEELTITLDFSDANKYRWSTCPSATGIENKAAEVYATKVMVNGQMFIQVGAELYTVQGVKVAE